MATAKLERKRSTPAWRAFSGKTAFVVNMRHVGLTKRQKIYGTGLNLPESLPLPALQGAEKFSEKIFFTKPKFRVALAVIAIECLAQV